MAENRFPELPEDLYRIGDYAKYMGVTPDFLKHYEQFGLIDSKTRPSGYRYYPFGESYKLLESIRLRNQGFSVRDCQTLLSDLTEDEVMEQMARQAQVMEQEIIYRQEILAAFRRFEDEMAHMKDRQSEWWIGLNEPMLFLPHTQLRTFIDDPRIYEILPDWIHWLPVVRSAVWILPDRPDDPLTADWRKGCAWGLCVPKDFARRRSLAVNDVVREVPAGKALFLHCRQAKNVPGTPESSYAMLWSILDQLSLRPAGPILRIAYMSTKVKTDPRHSMRFIVPLEA